MRSPTVQYSIAIVLGIGLGLFYGWIVNPVQFVDTTPESLRFDYRADYVLMVAEIYETDQNLSLAAQRLAVLGSLPPAEIAAEAYKTSIEYKYDDADISRIQRLMSALQAGGN